MLLAYFHNEDFPDAGFTLAQVLYLTPDEKVDSVFAFAKGEKSIEADLGQIESFARLRQQIEDRGFQATTTFKQYEKWFSKAVGFRSKAMEVFNQTVAVKDIVSLNDFIRRHMLEKRNWREEIDRILTHFNQLADAHKLLVRTREQLELLKPIVRAADRYEKASVELQQLQRLKGGCPGVVLCHCDGRPDAADRGERKSSHCGTGTEKRSRTKFATTQRPDWSVEKRDRSSRRPTTSSPAGIDRGRTPESRLETREVG